jgi:CPA1 family monovalent cation:H+ antiporter
MLRAERRMLVRLRNEGAISDDVLRELEQELDLEAVRVGVGEGSAERVGCSFKRGQSR